jgi:hypothetical protein
MAPQESLNERMAHMEITSKHAKDMTAEEKFTLITRNLQEVLGAVSPIWL